MTGLPTGTVKLDDGTGTYPTDVTTLVDLGAGITVSSYGRTDEFSTAQAAELELTLDNDGSLTSGATFGFDTAPFDAGPFGGGGGAPLLSTGQGIRFTETIGATTRNRFTGRLSTLDLGWVGGAGTYAQVGVTAVDCLADAERRTLRSMLEEEIVRTLPRAYYTMGEETGATSAGDTSGHQMLPLTKINDYGIGTVAFGSDVGTMGETTGVTWATGSVAGNPIILQQTNGALGGGGTWSSSSVSITFVITWRDTFPTTYTPSVGLFFTGGSGFVNVGFDIIGRATWNGCQSGASMMTGLTHIITAQAGGGLPTDLWVDGVKVDSVSTPMTVTWDNSLVQVNGSGDANNVTTIGHFAYGPRLADGDVQAIHNTATGATETTAVRFARLANYGGFPTTTTTGMSGQLMGAQDTSGSSLADALRQVEAAEGGAMYVNGSGVIVLQGKSYRAAKLTADQTVNGENLSEDVAVTLDTALKINQVTVTRTNGSEQLVSSASVLADPTVPVYPATLDLAVASDADALTAAQWLVAKHETPLPRLGSAGLDLMHSTVAESLFQREVGDRVTLSPMPSQLWSNAGDVTVEGWSETLTDESWDMTVNLLPWSLFESAVYDNAGYLYDTVGDVYA